MSDVDKDVRFHLLGPIQVFVGDDEVAVTGRERILLVTLLCNAGTPVELDRLVDAIWGDHPPRDARNQLQSCVSRLRRRLAIAGIREGGLVVTEPAGYRIRVDIECLDLLRFREQVAGARSAASQDRDADAVAKYRTALSMWNGPALAGVESDALRRIAASLDEEYLRAVEERIDLELALGRGGELIADLTDLVAKHPYRERLHGALMHALYRAGRQAEALMVYQRAREMLVDEIGTEPGDALREMQQRILTGDPTLMARTQAGDGTTSARHCLPRQVNDFTGRPEVVARLVEAARAGTDTATVLTIDGMAGVGKTTLAVHVAHLLLEDYPDAQLFIDLHGHSEQAPVVAGAALATLLRQLGVPSGRIPTELDSRAALWRHELAERRVLVVLDNAASTAQVAPLLPAGSGCLVLVTSRRRLTSLDSARPLSLGVLEPEEAVALLEQIVGDRIRHDPRGATALANRCGYLPLAIRLAGARLAHRPNWGVHDLAGRLRDARRALTELTAEDRTVIDALAFSYQPLTPELQRIFRSLGLHPGENFDAHIVAAMVDVSLERARHALDTLVDHHLVEESGEGRYRLHDVVREYAYHLALATDTDAHRRITLEDLFDFYLHATVRTSTRMERLASRQRFHIGKPRRPDLLGRPTELGMAWLEFERPNLVAAVQLAASVGYELYAWQMARAAWRFFYTRSYLDDLLVTHRWGLAAAELLGDDHAIATMCNYLASAYSRAGELDEAADLLRRSLVLLRKHKNRVWAAAAHMNLATVYRELGRTREAVLILEDVVAIQQSKNNVDSMGRCMLNLGNLYMRLGRYDEAMRFVRRSLTIARELGDSADRAVCLGDLGAIRLRIGQYRMASRLLTASLALRRRIGLRDYQSEVVNNLGSIQRQLGDFDEALRFHREALAIALDTGDKAQAYAARNELGQSLREVSDTSGALAQHQMVLAEATKHGYKYEQARALDGIAACLRDTDRVEARRHWQRALVLYREMGVPEEAEVERRLAELGGVAGDLAPGYVG